MKTTYIIKTKAPRGPRSEINETFVAVATDAEAAKRAALKQAHANARVTAIAELDLDGVARISVS